MDENESTDYDADIARQFEALQNTPAPDVWSRTGTAGRTITAARPLKHQLGWAAAMVVIAVIGGIAAIQLVADDTTDLDVTGEPDPGVLYEGPGATTSEGGPFDPNNCNIDDYVRTVRPPLVNTDYALSESLIDLNQRSAAVLRGRLLSSEETPDDLEFSGTVYEIATGAYRGTIDTVERPVETIAADTRTTPDGPLELSFLAFLTGDQLGDETGPWYVGFEGLWVACDDTSPARSVVVDPTRPGWDATLAGGVTLDELAEIALPVPHDTPGPAEPFVCPVTGAPEMIFVPPELWPATPSSPNSIWFGDEDLWTVVELDGYTPRKSVWWSANFPGGAIEEQPPIEVVYERLDIESEPIVNESPGTNAFTAIDGDFMINGIDPDESGCWRVTATYKGATLSYVYEK